MTDIMAFSNVLLKWYQKHGRHDLPWQQNPTPYRIWISEIMLQQTQVATVIPYYQRFMRRFPHLKSLAAAQEDEVLSHWSGLGYYARARNLHAAAKIIQEKYHGQFPDTIEKIGELPGIGLSTAGAIVSFAFKKRAVILDGNVKRVLARYFAIPDALNEKNTTELLWRHATQLTPTKNVHHYNQAIMDLGATLCTRTKPRCSACPLSSHCLAYQHHQPEQFPVKIAKKIRPIKKIHFLIIQNRDQAILLLKRPSSGIWGGLWGFPECEFNASWKQYQKFKLILLNTLPKITHQFTHFTLEIFPLYLQLQNNHSLKMLDSNTHIWYKHTDAFPGGAPTPVMKILNMLAIQNDT